jgi:hypothetical protein
VKAQGGTGTWALIEYRIDERLAVSLSELATFKETP